MEIKTETEINMKMNKKGFTLVEIMIVVLIIGLLAAIAVPSFTRARSRTRANTCISNMRLISDAKEQVGMERNLEDGAPITVALVAPFFRAGMPTCPEGNTPYTDANVGNLGVNPTCPNVARFPAHVLP